MSKQTNGGTAAPGTAAAPIVLTDAQRDTISCNVPLIYFVAGRYRGVPPATFEDLTGRLYHRLCVCVARYDASLGFRISPYIVRSLEGEAKNFFRDEIWTVKPPRKFREMSLGSDSAARLEREGANPQTIESCARPVCLDLLAERDGADQPAGMGAAPVDVERRVVDALGGPQLLRELFAWLRPEERYILALQMRRRPLSDLAERFHLTAAQSRLIWRELQAKVKRAYFALVEGERLPASTGSASLAQVLRHRFIPPDRGFVSFRSPL